MGKATPNTLSIEHLEKQGYRADLTERRIPHAQTTKDLFGFIDLVAIHRNRTGVLGIQATTVDHISHRRRKVLDDPDLRELLTVWLQAGNRFEIHGWRPDGTLKAEEITATDAARIDGL